MDQHQLDRRRVFTPEGFTGLDGVGVEELNGVGGDFRAAGISGEVPVVCESRSCSGFAVLLFGLWVTWWTWLWLRPLRAQPRLNGGIVTERD